MPESGTSVELVEPGTAKFGTISLDETNAGKTYTYTITETAGFGDQWTASDPVTVKVKVTDNGDGTLTATPTYTPENKTITNTRKTSFLTVSKTVVSSIAKDHTDAKFEFTVELSDKTINGTYGEISFTDGIATFSLKDTESRTATGLPTGITYTVSETAHRDYLTEKDGAAGEITDTGSTAAFINTRKAVTNASVLKIWADDDNRDGKRPASIRLELLADGKGTGKTVTLDADNNWYDEITELPKFREDAADEEIEYTWAEPDVTGYTLSNTRKTGTLTTLTNTFPPETVKIKAEKVWVDDGTHPNSVKVQLYADGQALGDAVELNAGNNWKHTWGNDGELCKYVRENGAKRAIRYTVNETEIPDGYVSKVTGDASTGFVITNTKTTGKLIIRKKFDIEEPPKPDNDDATTDIEVVKYWDDNGNRDGNRPETITVHLFAGGEEIKTAELSAANGWKKKFGGLPKFVKGRPIHYSITEDPVEQYSTEIQGFNIYNKYQPELTSVSVKKIWDDDDNKQGIRPKKIIMKLNNGMKVTLNEKNGWMASITGLPAWINGKPAVYTWTEQEIIGYEQESVTTTGNLTVFTNKVHRRKESDKGKTKNPGDTTRIEDYRTPLGVEIMINHVGDCFD